MAFSILCGIVGLKDALDDPKKLNLRLLFQLITGTIFFLLVIYLQELVNYDYMDELFLKLENKEEYKQIIDRLEHSILNIHDD